eukprot:TRINITY_DN18059_c0_g1_i1.p1 TRINITY_DN18059_c0_g1~~TRINITY_DN18059_c0_g1_i1.p1  ORF type:complete len:570 (+),score=192.11 TRINITY_DN18059_c0_g1_i1:74-1783(+)
MFRTAITAIACTAAAGAAASNPPAPGAACEDCPNIVLLMTDDQDELIGGWDPMKKTRAMVETAGTRAVQWRVHTPICAPSRAELQTGRYYHNLKSTLETPPEQLSDGAVEHLDLGGKVWPHVFPRILREEAGYVTGMFGKCMNGNCGVNLENGYSTKPESNLHLMGAFDRWFEGMTYDTIEGYLNTSFFDNHAPGCTWPWVGDACVVPTSPGGAWAGKGDGYTTATLGNKTVEFIHEVAGKGRPFFVYFAPHAPHTPSTPAPWYERGTWCDDVISPRLPNWNYTGVNKSVCSKEPTPEAAVHDFHELVSCQPYFDVKEVSDIDTLAQNRCRTLLSVDDSYAAILSALDATGVAANTYVLVTSDHGYNLGHHGLPSNKFVMYEHALRVPMLFRGPGVAAGAVMAEMGTQVDLAPTILGLAGLPTPDAMDGRSFVANVVSDTAAAAGSVRRALLRAPGVVNRTSTFHEYYDFGPFYGRASDPPRAAPLDDWSNTYIALTYRGPLGHYKYGVYDPFGKQTGFARPNMRELFDLAVDPYELHNVHRTVDPAVVKELEAVLYSWYRCQGAACAE